MPRGRVLLPGLFDMHAHIGFWDGGLHLAAGVTTVRDMGNDNDTLQQIIAQEEAGTLLMPHIVPAGFIEGESPNAARNGFVIKNLDEAKHAVDWYHEHRYPQIKIYNSFPKEILPDVTAYAHSSGMRVSGHIPGVPARAGAVSRATTRSSTSTRCCSTSWSTTRPTRARSSASIYRPRRLADLDFDSKPVQDFIALLVRHKTVVDPTLATFDFIRQRDGVMSQEFAAVADHLPPDVRRGFLQGADEDPGRRDGRALREVVRQDDRVHRPHVPRRHSAGGGHR